MEDFYTTHQVQDLLKVDRITVYRMLQDGRLRGVKIGKQWRFACGDVEALLTKGARTEISGSPIPSHCIQPFQDVIAGLSSTGMVIISEQGEMLTQASNPCAFCSVLQKNPAVKETCAEDWRWMEKPPHQGLATCHAGLVYAVAPIRENQRLVALLLSGPYRRGPLSDSTCERLAREFQADASLLREKAKEIPEMTNPQQTVAFAQKIAGAVESLLQERTTLVNKLQRIAEITSM